jgi:PRTRC genetic system ThiF family protein
VVTVAHFEDVDRFHIVLVGCGGTGSYILYYLSRLMFTEKEKPANKRTTLILVDGDTVEHKNLYRQNYVAEDVGRNKAAVLARRYGNAYGINLEYCDYFIETPEMLKKLLKYTYRNTCHIMPVIIGAVDNYRARRVLHETFEDFSKENYYNNILYVDAGNSEFTGQVVIGARYREWKKHLNLSPAGCIFPNLLEPEDGDEGEPVSCADLSLRDGQTIMANMATASLVNMALNNIINHRKIPFHIASVDTRTCKVKTVPVRKMKKS